MSSSTATPLPADARDLSCAGYSHAPGIPSAAQDLACRLALYTPVHCPGFSCPPLIMAALGTLGGAADPELDVAAPFPEDAPLPARLHEARASDHIHEPGWCGTPPSWPTLHAALHFRHTPGSVLLPILPPAAVLLAAADEMHVPPPSSTTKPPRRGVKLRLTIAGRALAKHAHRGGEGSWWGGPAAGVGPDPLKNVRGLQQVAAVLAGSCGWRNLHAVPTMPVDGTPTAGHPTPRALILELRIPLGYGARWYIDVAGSAGGSRSAPTWTADSEACRAGSCDALTWHAEDALVTAVRADSSAPHPAWTVPGTGRLPDSVHAASQAWQAEVGLRVSFRGFLEPPRHDGHAHKWRAASAGTAHTHNG